MSADLKLDVERIGQPPAYTRNVYAALLKMKWRWALALFMTIYLLASLLFAGLFLLGGDCISGARAGSFMDAFFFSVQTISTIGFGSLAPSTLYSNAVVFVESFFGLLLVALATGLVFAKFARPTAGVMFTDKITITPRNGKPTLTFRLANARGSDIIEASIRVTVLMTEHTEEGETMRRLHDLKVLRSTSPVFVLSWAVMHEIDETSPLFDLAPEDFEKDDVRVIVNMTGIDGTFSQTVFAYRQYLWSDIVHGQRFADVIKPKGDGGLILDLTRFHDLEPTSPVTARS